MADKWYKQMIPLNGGEGEIDMAISLKGNSNKELLGGAQLRSLNFLMQHKPLCGGIISFNRISEEKNILYCQGCGLRINVPTHRNTIGELVVYLMVHS